MTNKAQAWLLRALVQYSHDARMKKNNAVFWTVFKRITSGRALHNSLIVEGLVWQSMIYGENDDRTIFPNSSAMVSLYSHEMLLLAALLSVFNIGTDSWPPVQVVKGGLRLCCSKLALIVCINPVQYMVLDLCWAPCNSPVTSKHNNLFVYGS